MRLLAVLFFINFTVATAQFNNFKKWSVKNGLIQSDIYDITQDSRGYLWVASGGGVSVFDGVKFKHYTKKNGLAGNTVRCVFEDKGGKIWFGTNEGLCYYDGLKFTTISDTNFKGTTVLCFAQCKDGSLLIGTDDGGLNILKFDNGTIAVENINESKGLSSNSVFDIAIDSQQKIWLATYGGGITILTDNKKKYDKTIIKGFEKLQSDELLTIEINGDDVWIGSANAGATKFSRSKLLNNDFSLPEIHNVDNGLNSNFIWDILVTKDNKIWLASQDNGINRLEKKKQNYINTSFTNKNGLSDKQILSLYEDRQQNIWIGTNGNGLNMLSGDHFSHYSVTDGLPSNKIQSIQQDTSGAYWLASSGGGLSQLNFTNNTLSVKNYADKDGLTDFISSIAIGKAGNKNIWFATDEHGIVKFNGSKFYNYTEKDGLVNNRVYSICVDSKGIVWSGTSDGISRYDGIKFINVTTDKLKMQNEGVKAIVEDNNSNMWFGTSGGLARYKGDGDIRTFDEVEGLYAKDINALAANDKGDVFIGTNTGGLYKYNHLKNDTNAIEFVMGDSLLVSNSIRSLLFLDEHTLIAGTFKGFDKIYFDNNFKIVRVKHFSDNNGFTGLECNDNAILLDNEKNIWFGTVNGISKYSPALDNKVLQAPVIYITDVQLFFKDVDWTTKNTAQQNWFNVPNSLTLPYFENHLTFKFHAGNFSNPEGISYKFKLDGRDKDWSPSRKNSEETFSGLEPGSYTFMVMAQNEDGAWSEPAKFSFTITPPWYKTTVFYIAVIVVIIIAVYSYIKWREKKLVLEKEVLEDTVRIRTSEVVAQKHIVEEKHKEITDSINYAERIQRSFLASDELLNKFLKNYFILFKPKDVVSGDFYWADEITGSSGENNFILATADSTGHGVPGAIMSLLNITSLEKAVEHLTNPADILNHTRKTIIKRLKKDGSAEGGKDGMDCSLILFDFKNKKLHIAAANNPVWIVTKNENGTTELVEIKPDKMPVGKHDRDQESFKLQTVDIIEGDVVYTLTDGFPDQFGGEKGKKFMSKNLKELLLTNSQLPMSEQKGLLESTFKNWVGNSEQVDDVTLIGIKL
jgi:ligand-binding sensor domain-containing protein/serine phosphatase RsbU (regulator of sigma subunit)